MSKDEFEIISNNGWICLNSPKYVFMKNRLVKLSEVTKINITKDNASSYPSIEFRNGSNRSAFWEFRKNKELEEILDKLIKVMFNQKKEINIS